MISFPAGLRSYSDQHSREKPKFSYDKPENVKFFLVYGGLGQLLLPLPALFVLYLQLQYILPTSIVACVSMMISGVTSIILANIGVLRAGVLISTQPEATRRMITRMAQGYGIALLVTFATELSSIGHSIYAIYALPENGTKQWNSAYTCLFVGIVLLLITGSVVATVRKILQNSDPSSSTEVTTPAVPVIPTAPLVRISKKPPRYKRGSFFDVMSVDHDPETATLLNGTAPNSFPPSYTRVKAFRQVLQDRRMNMFAGRNMTSSDSQDYLMPPRRPNAPIREDSIQEYFTER